MIQSSPVGPCASTKSILNTFVDCSARPPFEHILSHPWWICAMKNLFPLALFIGSKASL
jgi:hypothetical protein